MEFFVAFAAKTSHNHPPRNNMLYEGLIVCSAENYAKCSCIMGTPVLVTTVLINGSPIWYVLFNTHTHTPFWALIKYLSMPLHLEI